MLLRSPCQVLIFIVIRVVKAGVGSTGRSFVGSYLVALETGSLHGALQHCILGTYLYL